MSGKAKREGAYREVALTCSHSNGYPEPVPSPGALAYCHRCRDYRRVARPTKES